MERVLEPEVMDTAEEATTYDAMDFSLVNQAFVDRLRALGGSGRILDLGTGPGHIPLLIVERDRDAHVTGIDLADHMLALAERKRAASPHRDRLCFARADAKGLDAADDSFDTVVSNTILHHIPDPMPFLREARRVLRPGGTLLIRDLYRPPSEAVVARLLARHAADDSDGARELFRASLCAALSPGELREIADAAGLADARLVIDTDRHMSLELSAAA
jgi:ubiquinone/menaquinone biosynthesis C-methylase UbiE